jgi:DNA polymerase-3 subunit epsilon
VRFRGDGTVVDTYEQLVNPCCEIPAGVIRIHGITNEMVRDQPTVREVLPELLRFVGLTPTALLAHNAGFDVGFLSAAYGQSGCSLPSQPVIDTCALARQRMELPNYRLETIGRFLRLVGAEAHRALADSLLLKDVFLHFVRRRPSLTDVRQLLTMAPPLSLEASRVAAHDLPPEHEHLIGAMETGHPVQISYCGTGGPGCARRITPLRLFRVGRQLYLAAICHQSGSDKTFRLDRIVVRNK